MSDQRNQIYGFYQLRIISADNPPQCSKLYVKIYLCGAIRSYIDKTGPVSYKKCEWKTGWYYFNPVRGTRIHFELFNDDIGVDKIYAIGNFDPKVMRISQNGEVIRVPLNHLNGNYQNEKQPTFLNVIINYFPRNIPELPPPKSNLGGPFYISVDPQKTIALPDLQSLQNFPNLRYYRFPYELSAFLFDDQTGTFSYVNSGNRECPGAQHSGVHIPGSYSSLSPVIRLDPKALEKSGKYVYIVLSTPNYTPLKNNLNNTTNTNESGNNDEADARVTIWKTDEPENSYSREDDFKIRESGNKMEPFGQFAVRCNAESSLIVVAVGYIRDGKITFAEFNHCLDNEAVPSFQDASEVFPLLLKSLKYDSIPSPYTTDTNKVIPKVAQLVPRSISQLFRVGFDPQITAVVGNLKKHAFSAFCLNSNMKTILTCNKSSPNQLSGALSYVSGNISIDLGQIPSSVNYICFIIYGEETLERELTFKSYKTNESLYMKLLVNNLEVIKTNAKYSRTKNAMLWFALYRDPFGGWSILNVREGVEATNEVDVVQMFVHAMQNILAI